jgi:alpha-1,3-rhamnosyl/mannosyltransferase
VLFMGTLEPRKNIGVLLDAYARLLQRRPHAPDLILAGGASAYAAPWLERIAQPPLAGHVQHVGYVTNEAREGWYARARVLVLPSLDEGFGLPVLEAMAGGVPVIASNRGALPEVTGGAAPLIEPGDADALAGELERLLEDPDWARACALAGLERAASYTWERTASRLHEAYVAARNRRQGTD